MAKEDANKGQTEPPAEGEAPFQVSPEVLQMAKSCFDGADEAARRGNCDYAIALYLQGLRYTPDEVERGHKPLHEAALRLKAAGKSKGWASKVARMKANVLQMTGKKKEAFFEQERAMAGSPESHVDLAVLAQAAQNLSLNKTAVFFADQALEAGKRSQKLTETACVQMGDIYEANELYRRAMFALQDAEKLDKTQSGRHMKRIRDLAARTTIDSGLEDADTFHERIKDAAFASDSAKQKVVTAEDEMVERAEQMAEDLEKAPNDVNLMLAIGDMYARAQHDEEALKYYRKARTATGGAEYRVKVKMDDLRMRQFRQQIRAIDEALAADPDNEETKAKHQDLIDKRNQFELAVYQERSEEYPTDMTVRYELGLRLYRCGDGDKAIGAFQLSTRDPKRKILSLNMLGKCFFQRRLYQEAAAQFQAAIDNYEIEGDPMWKELRYNLGLTYEATQNTEEASNCYSQIVMADFQYRDAAKRLQELRGETEGHAGPRNMDMQNTE